MLKYFLFLENGTSQCMLIIPQSPMGDSTKIQDSRNSNPRLTYMFKILL